MPWTWTCIYYSQNNQIYLRAYKRTSSWNLFWIFRHANGMHIWKLLCYISCSGRYIPIAWLNCRWCEWLTPHDTWVGKKKWKRLGLEKCNVKRGASVWIYPYSGKDWHWPGKKNPICRTKEKNHCLEENDLTTRYVVLVNLTNGVNISKLRVQVKGTAGGTRDQLFGYVGSLFLPRCAPKRDFW